MSNDVILGFSNPLVGHHYMEAAVCVVPSSNVHSVTALSALIHALHEMDRVGIARYVRCANAEPKLCVLAPYIGSSYECLYMNVLPFVEDLRHYPFQTFANVKVSAEQEAATEDLIKAMDLTKMDKDEEGYGRYLLFNNFFSFSFA